MLSFVLALNMMLSGNCSNYHECGKANSFFLEKNKCSMVMSINNFKPQDNYNLKDDALDKFITNGPVNFRVPKEWNIEEYTNAVEFKKDNESIGFVVYGPYNQTLPFEAYVGKHLQKFEKTTFRCHGFKKAYKLETVLAQPPSNEETDSLSFTHYLFIDKEGKNYIMFSSSSHSHYLKTFEKVSKGVERNVEYYSVEKDFGNADAN